MEFIAQQRESLPHSSEKKSAMEALAHLRPTPLRTSSAAAFVALSLDDDDDAVSPTFSSLCFGSESRSTSFGSTSSVSSPQYWRRCASPTNRLLQRMPVRPRSPTDEDTLALSPRSILRRKISKSASVEIEIFASSAAVTDKERETGAETDVEHVTDAETESEYEGKGERE